MDDSGPALAAARACGIRRHRHLVGAARRPSGCRSSAGAACGLTGDLAGPPPRLPAGAQSRRCQRPDRRSRVHRAAVAADSHRRGRGFSERAALRLPIAGGSAARPDLDARAGAGRHLAAAPLSAPRIPAGGRPSRHRACSVTVPMATAHHQSLLTDLRALINEPGNRTVMLDGSRDVNAGLTLL